MIFGSLFAGIGGLDLGLERAGMRCAWQVEIDPFCQKVLAKHWPSVTRYEDVKECGKHNLEPVDLICGGFPCIDVSHAGKKAGLRGQYSGLWAEFARIVGEIRPQYVLVENVAGLLVRGISIVLADLATLGYDAEWGIVPALAIGSPHLRERLFILAYPNGEHGERRVAFHDQYTQSLFAEGDKNRSRIWQEAPANSIRMADGIPNRVDRLRVLGNAVVPQVAEWIGRQIVSIAKTEG
ncbi:MAG: DNA (cytosine-5-)-methyltransferase [Candidatus Alkanophagales archaeon]|nr:MAG: DNA (cytosine-5-)-methyltransferase [Candidatus Alkanophagales archaeon]